MKKSNRKSQIENRKSQILVLGSGGREHAIAWKLAEELGWERVFTAPGNAGIPNSYALDISDFEQVRQFCQKHQIDTIFVGPEQPLSEGIVDFFADSNIRVLGPDKQAAQLEASKIFAKQFMAKYGISTADFKVFHHIDPALEYVAEKQGDLVIKFDGLAGGKGVFVCSSIDEATDALRQLSDKYRQHVDFIIEDKISGDEVSIIGFTDGKTIKTLLPSQDHKQLNDGDLGPNTGGMGAFCPVDVEEKIMKNIRKTIIEPTLKGIQKEEMNYKGVIYFGIMVKDGKGYLLEYNVRFGDPETEVLLPSLKTSLVDMVEACLSQELSKIETVFYPGYFVDVVLVSGGYPKAYKTGKMIKGLDKVDKDILVFHAGTKKENNHILTNGGRVLNIVVQADSLEQARKKVYDAVDKIHFENMYYRKDIGLRTNKHLKS